MRRSAKDYKTYKHHYTRRSGEKQMVKMVNVRKKSERQNTKNLYML